MKRWVSFIVSVFMCFSCTGMDLFAIDEQTQEETVEDVERPSATNEPVDTPITTVEPDDVVEPIESVEPSATPQASLVPQSSASSDLNGEDGNADDTGASIDDNDATDDQTNDENDVLDDQNPENDETQTTPSVAPMRAPRVGLFNLSPSSNMTYDLSELDDENDNLIEFVDGDGCSADNPHIITGETSSEWFDDAISIDVNSGVHYIQLNNVIMDEDDDGNSAIDVTGSAEVHLQLVGDNSLSVNHNSNPGIWINSGASLFIEGDGSLNVTGDSGIGGEGSLTIENGTINATGNHSGAGIDCANVTINGGQVTATGSSFTDFSTSAGIRVADGRHLLITGGTVNANGASGTSSTSGGAGIGGNGGEACGTITINGGTVTANGGTGAAAIGTGYDSGGEMGGVITVNGGSVYALSNANISGATGAGIGSGANVDFIGTINLNGGLIYAQGHGNVGDNEFSPSIGSGSSRTSFSDKSNINIGTSGTGFVVVVAPNGISSVANLNSWNGILVNQTYTDEAGNKKTQEISIDSVKYDGTAFIFNGVTANTIGKVEVQSGQGIVLNSGSTMDVRTTGSLFVGDNAPALSQSALLKFDEGAALSGSGGTMDVNGEMDLYGGHSQVSGSGVLSVDENGTLKILLSDDMVSSSWNQDSSGVYSNYYSSVPFEDSITVKLTDLWGYSKQYTQGVDYIFTNLDQLNPLFSIPDYYTGSVTANDSAQSLLLIPATTQVNLNYRILSNYGWSVNDTFTVSKVEHDWMQELPKVGYSGKGNEYPIVKKPTAETSPDTTQSPYTGTLTYYLSNDYVTALTNNHIKEYISTNPNAQSMTVYWEYVPSNNANGQYAPYIRGSLSLNLVDARVLTVDVYENGSAVSTLNKTYGDTFTLTLNGIFNDNQEAADIHDVSWNIKCTSGNTTTACNDYLSVIGTTDNTITLRVDYIPTDTQMDINIVASVPEHIQTTLRSGLDNHASAQDIVSVQLNPKPLSIIESDPITKYYDANDATVNESLANFKLDTSGLINNDQLNLSWLSDDLAGDYKSNTRYEVNTQFTLSDVDGVTNPIAHCYTLVNAPTLKVQVIDKPTTPVVNDDSIVNYDDGRPFTTDNCGSVYDRWGNLIYQGVCDISASGYRIVPTSDD